MPWLRARPSPRAGCGAAGPRDREIEDGGEEKRHLAEWFPPFLSAGAGIQLPGGPSVDEDPVSAWRAHCDAVQALLDDPATQDRVLANPHIGELPLARAVDQFYTTDVFMHTWDLARSTGQDDRLDAAQCSQCDHMCSAWRRTSASVGKPSRETNAISALSSR